jgi:methionine-rich copper-binding protein CopC
MKRALLMAVAALGALPLVAQAHARLISADPADGSVLIQAPRDITLKFSEAAQLTMLSIQKDDAPADAAARKLAVPSGAKAQFTIAAPPLTPGHYSMHFRVLSDDNHVVSGTVRFTVGAQGSAAPP